MSVLIKKMGMPKECGDCPCFSEGEDDICQLLWKSTAMHGERLPNCPLVEVPTHGRLIDADKLKESVPDTDNDGFMNCRNCGLLYNSEVEELIDDAPTVIESEVE